MTRSSAIEQAALVADSGVPSAWCGKGDRVVVTGRLRQSTFRTDEGPRRSMIELIADEVALSLLSKGFQPVRTGSGDTEERAGSVAPEAGKAYAR